MTNSEMVFMMGNPAAGKSTVAYARFGDTHRILDCDDFKKLHPEYDPNNPGLVHQWSRELLDRAFNDALNHGAGFYNYVIDGTGSNAEHLVYDIKRARTAGFKIKIFYVKCSLETSLRRNAERVRHVPEDVVRDKAQHIAVSFEIVSKYADEVEVVDNNVDK